MHRKQGSHDREAAADDDCAGVTAPRAGRHQQERQDGRGERADADAVEMHPERRHHHHAAVLGEHEDKRQREAQEKHDRRQGQAPHSTLIDNSSL